MSGQTRSGRATRDEIVDALKGVKINPGQQLRHVEVSQDIYDMAKNFARWAPNFGAESRPYRFKMDFVYQLLQNNINSKTLQEAPKDIEGWQSACKALLRYALNLLLAPKRPEFRRLKVGVTEATCLSVCVHACAHVCVCVCVCVSVYCVYGVCVWVW